MAKIHWRNSSRITITYFLFIYATWLRFSTFDFTGSRASSITFFRLVRNNIFVVKWSWWLRRQLVLHIRFVCSNILQIAAYPQMTLRPLLNKLFRVGLIVKLSWVHLPLFISALQFILTIFDFCKLWSGRRQLIILIYEQVFPL